MVARIRCSRDTLKTLVSAAQLGPCQGLGVRRLSKWRNTTFRIVLTAAGVLLAFSEVERQTRTQDMETRNT